MGDNSNACPCGGPLRYDGGLFRTLDRWICKTCGHIYTKEGK